MKDPVPFSRPAARGIERRCHPRFNPNRQVGLACTEGVLSVFGWGKQLSAPKLLDLSHTGLKLATSESLKAGSVFRLELATEGLPSKVETFGEVRWSEPSRTKSQEYNAGIEFFGIAAQKIDDLRRLCEHLQHAP